MHVESMWTYMCFSPRYEPLIVLCNVTSQICIISSLPFKCSNLNHHLSVKVQIKNVFQLQFQARVTFENPNVVFEFFGIHSTWDGAFLGLYFREREKIGTCDSKNSMWKRVIWPFISRSIQEPWEGIWRHTVEKILLNVTTVNMNLSWQFIWGDGSQEN